MSEIFNKLKEKLKPKNEHETAVRDYIIWQLMAMTDVPLAETTAEELANGVLTLSGAVKAVSDLAKKNGGGVSDQAGYRAVREYLHISKTVTDAEAALFFLRDIPKEQIIELIQKVKSDDPAVTKPMLDLGLDDLFG